jgi:hypothetical protein
MRTIIIKLPYAEFLPVASTADLAHLFRAFADDAADFLSRIADDLESENPACTVEEIQFALEHGIPFIASEPTDPAK